MKTSSFTVAITAIALMGVLAACSQNGDDSQPTDSTAAIKTANSTATHALLTASEVKVSLEQVGALGYASIDDSLVIRVKITNNGPVPLPASGTNNVLLGGVQLTKGSSGTFDVRAHEYRSPLPADLDPGASIELDLRVPAPDAKEGVVKVGLLQENIAWFDEKSGQTTLSIGPLAKCAETNDLCMLSGEPLVKL